MNLNSNERIRYNRHLILDSFGEVGQLKLKKAKVLVIGAGGLGCPALLYLAAAGVGKIGIVDFDVVEETNLQRQVIYSTDDIGKSKAILAARFISAMNPFIEVEAINEQLTVENIVKCMSGYEIILDGTDNFASRYLINDACVLLNKTLVYGSVLKFEGQVAVFNHPLQSGERSATYRCLFPEPPDPSIVNNCSDVGVLGVVPGIVGTLQATEAIKIITGTGNSLAGKLLSVDLKDLNFVTFDLERNEKLWKDHPNTIDELMTMNYDYFCGHHTDYKSIDYVEFERMITCDETFQVIDVRELNEGPELREFNFVQVPFSSLTIDIKSIDSTKNTVVVCASGNRSKLAIKTLLDNFGFTHLINLEGGLNNWLEKTRKQHHV